MMRSDRWGRGGENIPMPPVGEGQPFQIRRRLNNIGKTVESTKKRITWTFCFGEEGGEHEVVLEHSTLSGKKRLFLNGDMIFESQKIGNNDWSHGWPMGSHVCRCDILGEGNYELTIDAKPFGRWPRIDQDLAAQLAAAKMDSEKTLKEDEQRRLDMINEQRKYDLIKEKGRGITKSESSNSSIPPKGRKVKPKQQSLDILSSDLPPLAPHTQSNFDPFSFNSAPGNNLKNDSDDLLQVGMSMQNTGTNFGNNFNHFSNPGSSLQAFGNGFEQSNNNYRNHSNSVNSYGSNNQDPGILGFDLGTKNLNDQNALNRTHDPFADPFGAPLQTANQNQYGNDPIMSKFNVRQTSQMSVQSQNGNIVQPNFTQMGNPNNFQRQNMSAYPQSMSMGYGNAQPKHGLGSAGISLMAVEGANQPYITAPQQKMTVDTAFNSPAENRLNFQQNMMFNTHQQSSMYQNSMQGFAGQGYPPM